MHGWILKVLSLLLFLSCQTFASDLRNVKSFHEWKHERVQAVQAKIQALSQRRDSIRRRLAEQSSTEAGLSASSQKQIDDLLQKEKARMALEKDLTVSDYFVGYLTKIQNRKQAFKAVAPKLSAEEIAELMDAYANSVFGTQSQQISSPEALILSESQK